MFGIYFNYSLCSHSKLQRSIFYVEGKESQKDILRLRQLEQARHENISTLFDASNDEAQSSSFNASVIKLGQSNGYPIEAAIEDN